MSTVVPALMVAPEQLTATKRQLVSDMYTVTGKQTGDQPLIYRDLQPNDLVVAAAGLITGRLSNQHALVANTLLSDDFTGPRLSAVEALAIFGYAAIAPSPQVNLIGFGVGQAKTVAQVYMDPLYAESRFTIGLFPKAILWAPMQRIRVDFLSSVAVGVNGEPFAFLGYVIEPEGNTVSPLDVGVAEFLSGGPYMGIINAA